MMEPKSVFHSGPVTALCCHESTVLAGIGSKLYVYALADLSNKVIIEVLHGRNLHGIRCETMHGDTRLCVFGQKCIRLVEYDPQNYKVKLLTDMIEFSDWIWDVVWLKDISAISLALGHNVVVTFDIERQSVSGNAHCQEKCIVYCAKFITNSQDRLIVAAGTVFNQVVLWSPVGKENENGRKSVIHRLTGHQGVIFSIDYDQKSQQICSVSDDRSIRLYQVKFRETMTPPSLEDWEFMDSSLLHVLYGHSARVWDVFLLSSVLVSVGEDSTCCVWSYEGQVIQKLKGHKGKSIWSMSVDKGENFVVTGGGDHSIRLWNLQQQGTGADKQEFTTVIPLEVPEDDFPRNTTLLDMNSVLVLTNLGNLVLYNYLTKRTSTLMADAQFASYTVMAVSPKSKSIAVGNIAGTLRIFTSNDTWEEVSSIITSDASLYKGRLFDVLWLNEISLLTTGPEGIVKLSHVDHHGNMIEVRVIHDLYLPPSKHRWVSAATYIQDGSHIVCGDRMGSVYLYCLEGENKNSKPIQTFPKLHMKAGVTSVCCHGDIYTTGRDGLYRVYSWTEQGNLEIQNSNRVFKGLEWVEKIGFEEDNDLQIQGFHANMFVVWSVQRNQKLLEIECGGGHRAWGVCCHGNKAQFVFIKSGEVLLKEIDIISNQTILKGSLHGRELCDAKHACTGPDKGGGHGEVVITCSEDTNISVSVLQNIGGIPTFKVLNTLGGHISSVRCLSVCPSCDISQSTLCQRKLIFSGGGRAQISVSRITIDFQTNRIENAINTDSGCIRGTIGGGGDNSKDLQEVAGESVSKTKIEESTANAAVISADNDVKCTVEHLTRIQLGQNGKRRKKPWKHFDENSDPETRVLDLTVISGQEVSANVPMSLFFLAMACSDGYVRFFAFNETTRELTQLSSSAYHSHCVLKTCHVSYRDDCVFNNPHDERTSSDLSPKNKQDSFTEGGQILQGNVCNDREKHCDDNVTPCSDDVTTFDGHVTAHCDDVTTVDGRVTAHCDVATTVRGRVIVLTAATDGKVAFWDFTEMCEKFACDVQDPEPNVHGTRFSQAKMGDSCGTKETQISPLFTLNLHQSGINSIYFSRQPDGKFMLLTGGDDNAIKVTMVKMKTSEALMEVNVTSQGEHNSAHAAQITGIWALSPDTILTASIDQRVCIWSLVEDKNLIKLSLQDCMFVDVMDIANMDVWSRGMKTYVLLSGEGLQVIEVDLSKYSGQTCRPSQSGHPKLVL